MRDPNRIPKIIKKLEGVWFKYPDLRFFQLISFLNEGQDLFYKEDDEVFKILVEKSK